jgi:hypothetical protein
VYQYHSMIPDGSHAIPGHDFPAASFIRYSLPKVLGRQVVLCTNEGNYQGQLASVGEDTVLLQLVGQNRHIHISSINAIVAQENYF